MRSPVSPGNPCLTYRAGIRMTARDKSSYEERSIKLFSCPQFILRPYTDVFKGTAFGVLVHMILNFCRLLSRWLNQPGNHGSILLAIAFGHIARLTWQAISFPQINEIAQALMIQICLQMGDRGMINHQIHKVHHPRGATESWDNTTPHLIEISVVWILKCRGFLPGCSYHRCPVQPCNLTCTKMLKVRSRLISFGQNRHLSPAKYSSLEGLYCDMSKPRSTVTPRLRVGIWYVLR